MTAVKAYYDGHAFIPQSPFRAEINQEAIITLLEPASIGISPKEQLLSFAGSLSPQDGLELEKILEDTERVYPDEFLTVVLPEFPRTKKIRRGNPAGSGVKRRRNKRG